MRYYLASGLDGRRGGQGDILIHLSSAQPRRVEEAAIKLNLAAVIGLLTRREASKDGR